MDNNNENDKPLFLWIPYVIYADPTLSGNAKLILGEIFNLFRAGNDTCWASNGHFSKLFSLSRANASYHLKEIEKGGWIKTEIVKDTTRGFRRIIYPSTPLSNILDTLSNKFETPIKNPGVPYQVAEADKNNIENNNKEKNNSGVVTPPPSKEVKEIYEFYIKQTGTKEKLSPKRATKIKARLKDFTVEECKNAILGAVNTPFYAGENDREWKADLDYIFRSFENTEKLIQLSFKNNNGENNRREDDSVLAKLSRSHLSGAK